MMTTILFFSRHYAIRRVSVRTLALLNLVAISDLVWSAAKQPVTSEASARKPFVSPEGSTLDALALGDERKLLCTANAENNSLAVANIENRAHSTAEGFIPLGWRFSELP